MTDVSPQPNDVRDRVIYTIGHVALPADRFVALLRRHGITLLVDIRRFPGSRTSPQFNPDDLQQTLAGAGIDYVHLGALGGRRQPLPESPNAAWNNASFRGYADYMETAEFRNGLQELMTLAAAQRVAIMCAEAVWWRCHRSMVSDALMADGWQVWHIMSDGSVRPHRYTAPARLVDGELTYHQADGGPAT
jgi:uncharacterized protein (DUF488 family)